MILRLHKNCACAFYYGIDWNRYDAGEPLSEIDGLPVAVKDNIFVKDMECTAASMILKGFRAPIDATVI